VLGIEGGWFGSWEEAMELTSRRRAGVVGRVWSTAWVWILGAGFGVFCVERILEGD
jgi:hypothetical protein